MANTFKVETANALTTTGSTVVAMTATSTAVILGCVVANTTTITGTEHAGNTLAYDAGYLDVYLNGIRMVNGTDVTVTSGTSIVFASAIGAS